ncbi:RidA family protein [Actinoallomurus sp. NBC_01490]|jgi:enamine deaminase RidA (YjgF/YER057c/UK114 family)|uniref:RidA family protein n=1 Tax=Actinoallomurus sp. NBC_01490 TaxID=2903557 RepID=UPI002E37CC05|nr:RidA family protein [Actinoallomurus sp. NBC_01490]
MSDFERRLGALGLTLPEVIPPVATYLPAVRSGDHVYVSGQVPLREGRLIATGRLGDTVSVERGYECARQCALNALAALKAEIGDLATVARVVKALVFVASTADFTRHPQVGDGASDLLRELFGDAGRHARSAVGVSALPLNAPVELELLVELGRPAHG